MLTLAATATVSATGGRPLTASLTGAAEVPNAGDPDGSGSAKITVNDGLGKVCYRIAVTGIVLRAMLAHIHLGGAGIAGAPVGTLTPPDATGVSSGCVAVSRALAKALIQNPTHYYVNVHNTTYPGGAMSDDAGSLGAPGVVMRAMMSEPIESMEGNHGAAARRRKLDAFGRPKGADTGR